MSALQVLAGRDGVRPSEIAEVLQVHPSLIPRQVQELEEAGYAEVTVNPGDARSFLVALTPSGADEQRRLTQVGLDRFALFVANWEPGEVQMLTALLEKLEQSKVAVAARERRPAGRRSRSRTRERTGRADLARSG